MSWAQLARHIAIAIGLTFVVAAALYLVIRFTLFAL
jgi:hypothetical protein